MPNKRSFISAIRGRGWCRPGEGTAASLVGRFGSRSCGPVRIVLVILVALLLSGRAWGAAAENSFVSARVCGECHPEQYRMWQESMHAHAMDDPIFQATYALAYMKTGGEAKELCLRCHAPTTALTGDFDQKLAITGEGVTCDFCHSVSAVDLTKGADPFQLRPGFAVNEGSGPAHSRKRSPVMGASEFCAGCHEYTEENGVALLGTYSEWRESLHRLQQVQCQDCHMRITPERVTDHRMLRFPGPLLESKPAAAGESLDGNDGTLRTRVARVERKGGSLSVFVEVTNGSAAHMIPTGMPSRSLVLTCEVETTPDGQIMTRQKLYRRRLEDLQTGRKFPDDSDLMLKPCRVVDDNRLMPQESRLEEFKFLVSPNRALTVRAYAKYLYYPLLIQRTEMTIQLSGDEKRVPAGPEHSKREE